MEFRKSEDRKDRPGRCGPNDLSTVSIFRPYQAVFQLIKNYSDSSVGPFFCWENFESEWKGRGWRGRLWRMKLRGFNGTLSINEVAAGPGHAFPASMGPRLLTGPQSILPCLGDIQEDRCRPRSSLSESVFSRKHISSEFSDKFTFNTPIIISQTVIPFRVGYIKGCKRCISNFHDRENLEHFSRQPAIYQVFNPSAAAYLATLDIMKLSAATFKVGSRSRCTRVSSNVSP